VYEHYANDHTEDRVPIQAALQQTPLDNQNMPSASICILEPQAQAHRRPLHREERPKQRDSLMNCLQGINPLHGPKSVFQE